MTCRTKREAETVLAERVLEGRQARRLAVDPNMRITEYSQRWLQLIASSVKPRTLQSYELSLRRHILPAFGAIRVRQLVRGQVKEFLSGKLASELSRNTVRIIHAALRAMLNAAIDDGVILANPADRMGRQFRLTTTAKDREQEIKAMDREQLACFLAAAKEMGGRYYALFFTLARTGLRLGEALALRREVVDIARREIQVERNVSAGHTGSPKGGRSRRVDMSSGLVALLKRLEVRRKTEALRNGIEVSPYVFTTRVGSSMDPTRVAKTFKRILKAADLPLHFSPHCLRHSFASLPS